MTDPTISPELLARQAIERCRREIEIAWSHVETAKVLLLRSRWMLERWIAETKAERAAHHPELENEHASPGATEFARGSTHRRRKSGRRRGRGISRSSSAHARRSRGSP